MRIFSRISLGAAFSALLLLGAGCSVSVGNDSVVEPPSVGDAVLAPDDGAHWWAGTIDQVDGTIYTVKFDADGKIVARPLTHIAPFPSGSVTVAVGDKVVAEWTPDSFYAGVVTAVSGDQATVKWDDGSSPSEVPLDGITQPFK